jgi:predicted XRE-type DNA-binding protein
VSRIWDNWRLKSARFHPAARDALRTFPEDVRKAFGKAIYDLQMGHLLMKNIKRIVAKNAGELAEVLGLDRAAGIELAVRSALNTKIVEVVAKKGLTHAEVAALAGTSRSRITAMLNRNTKDISTDLMLRVLGALGVSARVTFGRAA